ncbi:MAG: hypothetical protein Q7K42_06500, partial [Candidatus Diapherotrites archaeon]|nr:hypothetical protein [Candidatus Diapherotrites archaeon]
LLERNFMGNSMKIKCTECDEKIDIDKNEYDEGEHIECPECFADLILKVKAGKFRAVSADSEKYSNTEFDYEED